MIAEAILQLLVRLELALTKRCPRCQGVGHFRFLLVDRGWKARPCDCCDGRGNLWIWSRRR